jgi:hypothetical protein
LTGRSLKKGHREARELLPPAPIKRPAGQLAAFEDYLKEQGETVLDFGSVMLVYLMKIQKAYDKSGV